MKQWSSPTDCAKRSGKAFQAEDLPWFQAFADQGAIVLHLHQLLDENRTHAKSVVQRNQDLQATVATQAKELSQLTQELQRDQLRHDYAEIVGSSPALLKSLHLLDRMIDSDFPILLRGESGTGKELAARALHQNGPWAKGPFVPVNVAAISPGLLESELFGHVRGAFTGADRDRTGLLREADGGVLFLDEVTETDPDVQVKLLRFLEESQVRPVGADRSHPVQLRIVAATNKNPLEEVDRGRFRRDLYYRLAVVTVELPPLRERLADVRELVDLFLEETARRAKRDQPRRASDELIAAIVARPWPGNLRQLRNEVLRMDALSDDEVITLLNGFFVPIRVEESQRPDVDLRYNQNGWPTIVFLTPQGGQLFTVNYMDLDPLATMLAKTVNLYQEDREALLESASPVHGGLGGQRDGGLGRI